MIYEKTIYMTFGNQHVRARSVSDIMPSPLTPDVRGVFSIARTSTSITIKKVKLWPQCSGSEDIYAAVVEYYSQDKKGLG